MTELVREHERHRERPGVGVEVREQVRVVVHDEVVVQAVERVVGDVAVAEPLTLARRQLHAGATGDDPALGAPVGIACRRGRGTRRTSSAGCRRWRRRSCGGRWCRRGGPSRGRARAVSSARGSANRRDEDGSERATSPHRVHPARKLRRTVRRGLSRLVSTSTTLCQVPSAGSPARTGIVTDGATSTGSTWSAPWPGEPWAWR